MRSGVSEPVLWGVVEILRHAKWRNEDAEDRQHCLMSPAVVLAAARPIQ